MHLPPIRDLTLHNRLTGRHPEPGDRPVCFVYMMRPVTFGILIFILMCCAQSVTLPGYDIEYSQDKDSLVNLYYIKGEDAMVLSKSGNRIVANLSPSERALLDSILNPERLSPFQNEPSQQSGVYVSKTKRRCRNYFQFFHT